jgi:hypothetical protein
MLSEALRRPGLLLSERQHSHGRLAKNFALAILESAKAIPPFQRDLPAAAATAMEPAPKDSHLQKVILPRSIRVDCLKDQCNVGFCLSLRVTVEQSAAASSLLSTPEPISSQRD